MEVHGHTATKQWSPDANQASLAHSYYSVVIYHTTWI